MGMGDWGLGIGDWGLGIGDWANPQSPIPNPQSPQSNFFLINIDIYTLLLDSLIDNDINTKYYI